MRSLGDYQRATTLLKHFYISDVKISNHSDHLGEILEQHPQLIIVMNHGPMMGAIAGLIGLADTFQQRGGASRVPFGITWRNFYRLPISKQVLTFLTQLDHGVSFDEAMSLIQSKQFSDCVIMPEGALCNFGNGVKIVDFLSPRFIELAIRNQIPILLFVHQGSEDWAWPLSIDSRLLPLFRWLPKHMADTLKHTKTLSIPKLFKRKLDTLRVSFTLYTPRLTLNQLSSDKFERQQQLSGEAEQVKLGMQHAMKLLLHERNIDALRPRKDK